MPGRREGQFPDKRKKGGGRRNRWHAHAFLYMCTALGALYYRSVPSTEVRLRGLVEVVGVKGRGSLRTLLHRAREKSSSGWMPGKGKNEIVGGEEREEKGEQLSREGLTKKQGSIKQKFWKPKL